MRPNAAPTISTCRYKWYDHLLFRFQILHEIPLPLGVTHLSVSNHIVAVKLQDFDTLLSVFIKDTLWCRSVYNDNFRAKCSHCIVKTVYKIRSFLQKLDTTMGADGNDAVSWHTRTTQVVGAFIAPPNVWETTRSLFHYNLRGAGRFLALPCQISITTLTLWLQLRISHCQLHIATVHK